MTPKPIIAVATGSHSMYTPRSETQTVWSGIPLDYLKALIRSGGAPILLPYIADKQAIQAVLESSDGVLLPGGGDVVSLAYGEEPHPASHYQNAMRDQMEFEVIRLAIEMGLPILGICRGPQVLNVALGGTLVQDIPSQVEGALKHYSEGPALFPLHTVDIEPDSLLARVLNTDSLPVNSWHHQAVKDLGRGLRINCRAKDGVIEGVESSEGLPILAVQCHPEQIAETYPPFQALFDWLVAEAAKRVGK
ncbi:MAG: gamma-glutamyl-gamma-aminobutyrate hydrolase family protein [Armatimonadota bacterium]|nr:gamma-glutamyl-gamma-aminobutyrate hydrolase family protein [Armatimonadota bacterium]